MSLRMPSNRLRHIQLLQILLLLLGQRLAPHAQTLLNALRTTKPNNRTGNPLIDPRQRHLAHLPALLLSQLLYARDRLVVGVGKTFVFLWLGTLGCAEFLKGTREVAAEEGCPLFVPTSARTFTTWGG